MNPDKLGYKRKSYMEVGEIIFWTATINQWQNLLLPDRYKEVIIDSLDYLSNAGKIDVFGFVVMHTHIHLIWRTKELNGKETAQRSFLKYTAHEFRKMLYKEDKNKLISFKVNVKNKKYEFWQRDSLAIALNTKKAAYQILNYIHRNPLAKHWQLVKDACEYKYSSAKYYKTNEKNFSFLKNLREVF